MSELALKINLKERDLLHFEEEKAKPTEKEVSKLGSFLRINLLKASTTQAEQPSAKKMSSKELTLADVVVIKDKRK